MLPESVLVKVVISVLCCVHLSHGQPSEFSDWNTHGGPLNQPACVDIPRNLTLCRGIGYTKMRLPNLLDHDTIAEVSQQAASWVPVRNVRCHPNAQVFLCSLFTPVCLDRPIYPCRSLCEHVQAGCEPFVRKFGFPWPEMLRCDKFPVDNDMCISIQSTHQGSGAKGEPPVCDQCPDNVSLSTIMEMYCDADFVLVSRLRRRKRTRLLMVNAKVYKGELPEPAKAKKRRFTLINETCCPGIGKASKERYLVMGFTRGTVLTPSLIVPISKKFKKLVNGAIQKFETFECPPGSKAHHSRRMKSSPFPPHPGGEATRARSRQPPLPSAHEGNTVSSTSRRAGSSGTATYSRDRRASRMQHPRG